MLTQPSILYTPPSLNGRGIQLSTLSGLFESKFVRWVIDRDGHRPQSDIAFVLYHVGSIQKWLEEKMLYPAMSTAPTAAIDLPVDIKGDYEKAHHCGIVPKRVKRATAARIQKLCSIWRSRGRHQRRYCVTCQEDYLFRSSKLGYRSGCRQQCCSFLGSST